jgi:hypothetical protein
MCPQTGDDWRGAAEMYSIDHVSDHVRALTLSEQQKSDLKDMKDLKDLKNRKKIDVKVQPHLQKNVH